MASTGYDAPLRPRLKQQAVGEHVRRLRLQAGTSLRSLAQSTGFSASFMSQLENGQVSPSIGSMEKIAHALGVSLAQFFGAASHRGGGMIVRSAERRALSSGWSKAEIESLRVPRPSARFEAILLTLDPGGRSGAQPYPDPREQLAFVVRGTVTLTLGPDEHRLHARDVATNLAGELRLWRNKGRAAAQVLIVAAPAEASPLARVDAAFSGT